MVSLGDRNGSPRTDIKCQPGSTYNTKFKSATLEFADSMNPTSTVIPLRTLVPTDYVGYWSETAVFTVSNWAPELWLTNPADIFESIVNDWPGVNAGRRVWVLNLKVGMKVQPCEKWIVSAETELLKREKYYSTALVKRHRLIQLVHFSPTPAMILYQEVQYSNPNSSDVFCRSISVSSVSHF